MTAWFARRSGWVKCRVLANFGLEGQVGLNHRLLARLSRLDFSNMVITLTFFRILLFAVLSSYCASTYLLLKITSDLAVHRTFFCVLVYVPILQNGSIEHCHKEQYMIAEGY